MTEAAYPRVYLNILLTTLSIKSQNYNTNDMCKDNQFVRYAVSINLNQGSLRSWSCGSLI